MNRTSLDRAQWLHATLPRDGAVGQVIVIGPNIYQTVVNGTNYIPPMQKATFKSYRWLWPFNRELRWKLTEREEAA